MLSEEKLAVLEKTGSSDMQDLVAEVRLLRAGLGTALMALENGSAGIEHNPNDWCGHCYTKEWARRVRAHEFAEPWASLPQSAPPTK